MKPLVDGRFYISGSHITYGPLLVIVISIMLSSLMFGAYRGWRRVVVIGLILSMSTSVFLTGGRSGYVAFLIFIPFVLFYHLWRKKCLLFSALGAMVVFILLVFIFSPEFKSRIEHSTKALEAYQDRIESGYLTKRKKSSLEQRILFVQTAMSQYLEKPWLGHGTGSYEYAWNLQKRKYPETTLPKNTNPHNHHVLILVQFGVLGFLIYIFIFLAQLVQARGMPITYEYRAFALMLPLFYLLINNFDASFWSHQMQATFAYMTAIFFRRDMYNA